MAKKTGKATKVVKAAGSKKMPARRGMRPAGRTKSKMSAAKTMSKRRGGSSRY